MRPLQFGRLRMSRRGLVITCVLLIVVACSVFQQMFGRMAASNYEFSASFAGRYSGIVFSDPLPNDPSVDESDIEVLQYRETNIGRDEFLAMSKLPRLLVLDVTGCKFCPADFALLSSAPQLRFVRIDRTEPTAEIIATLTKLKNIESISIVYCSVSDEQVAALTNIPSLRTLAIGERDLTENEMKLQGRRIRCRFVDSLGRYYLGGRGIRL